MGGPDELPATFGYREARERGVSKRQLYRWRDEGAIEALSRGWELFGIV